MTLSVEGHVQHMFRTQQYEKVLKKTRACSTYIYSGIKKSREISELSKFNCPVSVNLFLL